MVSGDDVQLPDLQVIQRYSLAVRGATAPVADVIEALQADLAWLTGGTRRRPTAPAPAKAPATKPAATKAPASKAPASKAPVKKAPAKTTGSAKKKAPAKRAGARRA